MLQTSSINKEPHELEIAVKERQVTGASCSCKAGQHKCKHMVALLLHIHATETFDVLSSTDMPQQWGKEQLTDARKKYQPRLIAELPCSKKPRKEVRIPEENILERLLHGLPHVCSALRHSEGRSNAGASRASPLAVRQDKSEGTCRSPASPATTRQENSNAIVEQQSALVTRPSTLTEALAQAMETGVNR
ncbi:uncharacterized protein LOC119399435 [Rhipicephalus sanguineus]|uniref:uncharacterized protein LOC119399435 n=1 Tax=Rhipicephalus sanguineus TaxID=34632 RepID=UPI0020C52A29|nr:uncharacterized protein LOC119399435 [Rhipicephalus sanguineus]